MIQNCNDGSNRPPRLLKTISMGTLIDLPDWSSGPKVEGVELFVALREAGFEAVQCRDPNSCHEAGLICYGSFRTGKLGVADALVKQRKDEGYVALTTHAGWGIEDDDTADAYVHEVIEASLKHDIPVFIETHRATIFQDIWRSVQLVNRIPEVRFNGDFSHWYTGLEMPYGDMNGKLDFLCPVFERVRFFHGRIGNSSHMQVRFSRDDMNVQAFRDIWTRSMAGFLKTAKPGDVLPFAPELLPPFTNYARVFPDINGELREECDRWEQALLMSDIADECFDAAVASI